MSWKLEKEECEIPHSNFYNRYYYDTDELHNVVKRAYNRTRKLLSFLSKIPPMENMSLEVAGSITSNITYFLGDRIEIDTTLLLEIIASYIQRTPTFRAWERPIFRLEKKADKIVFDMKEFKKHRHWFGDQKVEVITKFRFLNHRTGGFATGLGFERKEAVLNIPGIRDYVVIELPSDTYGYITYTEPFVIRTLFGEKEEKACEYYVEFSKAEKGATLYEAIMERGFGVYGGDYCRNRILKQDFREKVRTWIVGQETYLSQCLMNHCQSLT